MFLITQRRKVSKSAKKRAFRPAPKLTFRTVQHSRWIPVDQVEIGMFVEELDVPWESTRFMFQGFVVDTPLLRAQVKANCEYARVRCEKMVPVSSQSFGHTCRAKRSGQTDWSGPVL